MVHPRTLIQPIELQSRKKSHRNRAPTSPDIALTSAGLAGQARRRALLEQMSRVDGSRIARMNLMFGVVVGCSFVFGLLVRRA